MKILLAVCVACSMPLLAQNGIQSDDFNGSSLNPFWTFSDAVGTGSVSVSSGQANISVPANSTHDPSTAENDAVLTQNLTGNADFSVAAKFNTIPTSAFQAMGLHAIHDSTNFIRCELYAGTSTLTGYAATITNGTQTQLYNTAF